MLIFIKIVNPEYMDILTQGAFVPKRMTLIMPDGKFLKSDLSSIYSKEKELVSSYGSDVGG